MIKSNNFLRIRTFATRYYLCLFFFIASCSGFHETVFFEKDVPDGPLEFQAGWYDGCRTGLASKNHSNATVYNNSFGSGIYQHDPVYQGAWGDGYWSCVTYGFGIFQGRGIFDNYPAK